MLTDKDTPRIVFIQMKCYQTSGLSYREYIWKIENAWHSISWHQEIGRRASITHKDFSFDLCMFRNSYWPCSHAHNQTFRFFYFPQASSVRPPLKGNAHARGTRRDLTSFLLVTLQECSFQGAFHLCRAFPFFIQEASKCKTAKFIRIRCKPMKLWEAELEIGHVWCINILTWLQRVKNEFPNETWIQRKQHQVLKFVLKPSEPC